MLYATAVKLPVPTLRVLLTTLACLALTGCPQDAPGSVNFDDRVDTASLDTASLDTASLDTASLDTASFDTALLDTTVPQDVGASQDTSAQDTSSPDVTAPIDIGLKDIGTSKDIGSATDTTTDAGSTGPCSLFLATYPELGHLEAVGPALPALTGMLTVMTTYNAATQARWGWYIRTDNAGKIAAKKSFSSSYNGLYDAHFVQGGGVLLGGSAFNGSSAYNGWVVRLDVAEKVAWQQVYGGTSAGTVNDVRDAGSEFVFAGHIHWQGAWNGWLGRGELGSGKLTWGSGIGGAKDDSLVSVEALSDGSLVAVGTSKNGNLGNNDVWVIRVDKAGKTVFSHYFGGPQQDEGRQVMPAAGSSLLVFGTTGSLGSGGFDMWVGALGLDGKMKWQRTYGGAQNDWFSAAAPHANGLVLLGTTSSKGQGVASPWVLHVDGAMVQQWDKVLGGSETAYGRGLFVDGTGKMAVSGWQQSAAGVNTGYLARLDPWGHSSCAKSGACATKLYNGCDDTDPCTLDLCSAAGCAHPTKADGSFCALGKMCTAGTCKTVP